MSRPLANGQSDVAAFGVIRASRAGSISRHRKPANSGCAVIAWQGSGPFAVALDSKSGDGLDRNGPFYSGTPLKEWIDGPAESLSRWNGHVAAAVGGSGGIEVCAVVTRAGDTGCVRSAEIRGGSIGRDGRAGCRCGRPDAMR